MNALEITIKISEEDEKWIEKLAEVFNLDKKFVAETLINKILNKYLSEEYLGIEKLLKGVIL